jgi:hypothetical protein
VVGGLGGWATRWLVAWWFGPRETRDLQQAGGEAAAGPRDVARGRAGPCGGGGSELGHDGRRARGASRVGLGWARSAGPEWAAWGRPRARGRGAGLVGRWRGWAGHGKRRGSLGSVLFLFSFISFSFHYLNLVVDYINALQNTIITHKYILLEFEWMHNHHNSTYNKKYRHAMQ